MRKKVFAVLLAVVFVMSALPVLANPSLGDLRNTYEEALAYVEEQQAELAVTQASIMEVSNELRELDERLVSAVMDMHSINTALHVTTVAMEQAKLDIAATQAELDRQYDVIVDRLRDMQAQGTMGLLSVVFQATSLRDFLLRLEYVNNVARQDRDMVARLQATEDRLLYIQGVHESQYNAVDVIRQRQQSYVDYLAYVEAERYEYFEALQYDEYRWEAMIALSQEHADYVGAIFREAYEAEQRRIAQDRARVQAERRAAETAAMANLNGQLLWPVPSRTLSDITSPFGPRIHPISRRQDNHSGMDIRATSGANIVAAESGVVIFSGWSGGYGLTVIIDHGGGVHTLYAHNSSNLVNVGDNVSRGQVIALIGSTGVSTGPHLHFEVRVNGRAVNPAPFLGI